MACMQTTSLPSGGPASRKWVMNLPSIPLDILPGRFHTSSLGAFGMPGVCACMPVCVCVCGVYCSLSKTTAVESDGGSLETGVSVRAWACILHGFSCIICVLSDTTKCVHVPWSSHSRISVLPGCTYTCTVVHYQTFQRLWLYGLSISIIPIHSFRTCG